MHQWLVQQLVESGLLAAPQLATLASSDGSAGCWVALRAQEESLEPRISMMRCGATVSAYQSLRLRTFHYQVQRHGAEHRLRLPMSAEVEGRSINLACTVS